MATPYSQRFWVSAVIAKIDMAIANLEVSGYGLETILIEVVVTSGSTKKLKKYQLRQVPEVWF